MGSGGRVVGRSRRKRRHVDAGRSWPPQMTRNDPPFPCPSCPCFFDNAKSLCALWRRRGGFGATCFSSFSMHAVSCHGPVCKKQVGRWWAWGETHVPGRDRTPFFGLHHFRRRTTSASIDAASWLRSPPPVTALDFAWMAGSTQDVKMKCYSSQGLKLIGHQNQLATGHFSVAEEYLYIPYVSMPPPGRTLTLPL